MRRDTNSPRLLCSRRRGRHLTTVRKNAQIADNNIPLSALGNLIDIWRGFEEHVRNDLKHSSVTIEERDGKMRMRTRKDIFPTRSSARLKASASAACRYRSWAKLHISLARCTSQPSEMAICRPRMERRVAPVDFSLVVGRVPIELRSSSVSKSLLLLFDGLSWSITAATSVVLNLQRRKFERDVAKVQRDMDS
jgi:hypothetical protein